MSFTPHCFSPPPSFFFCFPFFLSFFSFLSFHCMYFYARTALFSEHVPLRIHLEDAKQDIFLSNLCVCGRWCRLPLALSMELAHAPYLFYWEKTG
ncbi:hypothetical protein TRSC58_07264 [Trypanosoma rangeli SC58]|uniref:Uncharacterized protein n=1 Tax=Trypanosoma rangeli SC58 TaxID=429131 RepID=A0A061IRQ9_TRYRA|nr:hypothetical protein TRSC58_07264 [Trypanosoma rangeli SC58]